MFKNGKSVVRRCHRFYENGLPLTFFVSFFFCSHITDECLSISRNVWLETKKSVANHFHGTMFPYISTLRSPIVSKKIFIKV